MPVEVHEAAPHVPTERDEFLQRAALSGADVDRAVRPRVYAKAHVGGRPPGFDERILSALPVAELRAQADVLAKEIREVDTLIQRTNWEIDLVED
ncbi:hypothetical protein GCM10010502_57170 [Kitasatospora aureofaciens]|uniref:Uncharacterized protein n=1 Tax=Kitasatospora aureofaciens TaxID=1894 RepID=A0A8H9LUP3_KITAU|nr:hypothetical protein GCM10010502_57170 [Kitasatospora aureofaciens]